MPCGNSNNGVVCDNVTVGHSGLHSGLKAKFWNLFTVRVYWGNAADLTPAAYKKLDPGVLAQSSTGFVNEIATPELAPGGLTKSGNQTIAQNTYTELTGFTPRVGFEDTQQSGNGIQVAAAGNIRVKAQIKFGAVNYFSDAGLRVRKNGVVVLNALTRSTNSVTRSATTSPFAVAAGDVIFVDGYQAHNGSALTVVGTDTWFEVEVV